MGSRAARRRATAECLGTAFLLAAVVGSGIMAAKLADGNGAVALLCNTLPTGAILWVQENEYKPFWYYLEPDVCYFLSVSDIPADARYFLLPEAAAPAFVADPRVAQRHLHAMAQVVDGEKQRYEILGGK